MRGADAVLHLATRIQPLDKMDQFGMWSENDRLRAEASVILVDAALAAEQQAARFAAAGRHGVVLRLGLLDGPGTGHDHASRGLGATLHTEDAGRALVAALTLPSGIYNVCRDGERVSNHRFTEATGWHPQR